MAHTFSDSLLSTVYASQEIAYKTQHSAVEPLHLMLALCREKSGRHYQILLERGIDPEALENRLSDRVSVPIETGTEAKEDVLLPMTELISPILEDASTIAQNHRHRKVDTEHLLLAVIQYDREAFNNWVAHLDDLVPVIQNKIKSSIPNSKRGERSAVHLENYGVDLKFLTPLHNIVGREEPVSQLIASLAGTRPCMPILVGKNGAGKTSVMHQFAELLSLGVLPNAISFKRIISITLADMLFDTDYRGELQKRLQDVEKEAVQSNTLIFLDNADSFVAEQLSRQTQICLQHLLSSVHRLGVHAVAAMTPSIYAKYIERDSWCERRVRRIDIEPLSTQQTFKAVQSNLAALEKHYNCTPQVEDIELIVKLADRHCRKLALPGSAFNLLDQVMAGWSARNIAMLPEFEELDESIDLLRLEKERRVNEQDFEAAAGIRDQHEALEKVKKTLADAIRYEKLEGNDKDLLEPTFSAHEALARTEGVPETWLNAASSDGRQAERSRTRLQSAVIGQELAVNTIMHYAPAVAVCSKGRNLPAASYLLVGPTGCGKSTMVNHLAIDFCGGKEALHAIDMACYRQPIHAEHLKDIVALDAISPPGTEIELCDKPHVVVIENLQYAHPETIDLLISAVRGDIPNLGRRWIDSASSRILVATITVDSERGNQGELVALIRSKLKFDPLACFDSVVQFTPLTLSSLEKLASRAIDTLKVQLQSDGVTLVPGEGLAETIARMSLDDGRGGWSLEQVFRDAVKHPTIDKLAESSEIDGDKLLVVQPTANEMGSHIYISLGSR